LCDAGLRRDDYQPFYLAARSIKQKRRCKIKGCVPRIVQTQSAQSFARNRVAGRGSASATKPRCNADCRGTARSLAANGSQRLSFALPFQCAERQRKRGAFAPLWLPSQDASGVCRPAAAHYVCTTIGY